ncbi:hypothetical protein [Achromobacter sp. Marseille-Q4962]|uniref:hypothetical protein n=1 Tax=Achromobacter sp. Marseille-Q4962 TaxID=2942202 RepID=UPI002073AE69|nr:hypothetical protein [Achromobacter sp. Marseille-Q4962]
MNGLRIHRQHLAAALCAAGLVLAAGAAHAADAIGRAGIQAQYEQDVKNCKSGATGQERAACLREAGAARQEALRNHLKDADSGQYQQNMMERCQRLPAGSQQDCMTQMTSPTTVRGSVQGGGVLRETVIQVPAGTPGSQPLPPSSQGGMGAQPMGSQPR